MSSNSRFASSSARSTRVIEELQEKWESVKEQLEDTKLELESYQDSKYQSEKENEEFTDTNKRLRSEIQEIMQVLESKQQLMDSSKKLSIEAEGKVKQLKDEAVAARKELDDLKRRERTIEKERDTILAQKEKAAEQSAILQKSISQFEVDAAKEIEALELEVQQVEQKIQDTKQVDVAKVAEESLKKQAEQREEYMKQHETVKAQMEANTKEFVAHIRDALQDLMNEVASAPEEEDLGAQVTNCKDDVNSLVSRIQVNATISS